MIAPHKLLQSTIGLCVLVLTPALALAGEGEVACWSASTPSLCYAPPGPFTQISAGGHGVGLRPDGTIECWGAGIACLAPTGVFSQVSAGGKHTVGLRPDGTIECWGDNEWGQCDPPSGVFTRVEAGFEHNIALRENGTVACWGRNSWGQCNPPSGTFIDINVGYYNSVGIRTNGTLACWGDNSENQCNVPLGVYTQASMGEWGGVALKPDGTIECWGWDPYYGQCGETPAGKFVQVSASFNHIVALRANGTVACWGVPGSQPCAAAPSGPFTQIAAGSSFTLAVQAADVIEAEPMPLVCSTKLKGAGIWPVQQGIAFDGESFYTSTGTCFGWENDLGLTDEVKLLKWNPKGSNGWVKTEENLNAAGPFAANCHIGGIDVADDIVYAVLSDFDPPLPQAPTQATQAWIGRYSAQDLSPLPFIPLIEYLEPYNIEDCAGVSVGPTGNLYVVTYRSTEDYPANILVLDGEAPHALVDSFTITSKKANGIDLVGGKVYVGIDISKDEGAIEVYEDLCPDSLNFPKERRSFAVAEGPKNIKHAEGLTVLNDSTIWTAQWSHAVQLGTGGSSDPLCGGSNDCLLFGDSSPISAASGGLQPLLIDAGPDYSGALYLILGSVTGTSPGIPVEGLALPLNYDSYFDYTLSNPNSASLQQSLGVLDSEGTATALFVIPANFNSSFVGAVVHHAAAIIDIAGIAQVSAVSCPTDAILFP